MDAQSALDPVNRYCQRLGLPTPSLDVALARSDVRVIHLMALAVLEAGGPLSLDEIAAPEAAGAPATTRSRCKPSVAPKGIARPGAARARSPRLLEILFDPRHPEFEEMRTWAGAFEPERFDLGRVNAALAAVPAY